MESEVFETNLVISEPATAEKFLTAIKNEIAEVPTDASIKANRELMRSAAAKIAKTAKAIDKARLDMTADLRAQTKTINDAGKELEGKLRAMQEEVRQPLTEWEAVEKVKTDTIAAFDAMIAGHAIFAIDTTSQDIKERINKIRAFDIDPDIFGKKANNAFHEKEKAIESLSQFFIKLEKEEQDRAELERLKQEAAAKEQQEAQLKRDEEIRQAAIKQEQDRIAAAELRAQKEEADKRANREYVSGKMTEAKNAIMALGINEELAKLLVKEIVANKIPNISFKL